MLFVFYRYQVNHKFGVCHKAYVCVFSCHAVPRSQCKHTGVLGPQLPFCVCGSIFWKLCCPVSLSASLSLLLSTLGWSHESPQLSL